MVSIKAVRVSVLCRDPWKKHLSTYHVKELWWILSYQHRLWKIENVEKKCFINSSKFGLACFFGCSGNLKYLCKENSGKYLFYLVLCIIHEYQFIFSDVMYSFATDCMGKVSALLLVRIPLLMVDVSLKCRAFGPSHCLIGSKYRVVFGWGLMSSVRLWER